jgi:hypothetical protein
MGKLIPAGTGCRSYAGIQIEEPGVEVEVEEEQEEGESEEVPLAAG